jgi:hypothetical protein
VGFSFIEQKERNMNETIWSCYEAYQYADTLQNWKHLQARKGQFHEIHRGYYAARDGSTIKCLPNGMLDVRLIPSPVRTAR